MVVCDNDGARIIRIRHGFTQGRTDGFYQCFDTAQLKEFMNNLLTFE